MYVCMCCLNCSCLSITCANSVLVKCLQCMLLAIVYFRYVCLQGRTTAQELLSRVLNAVDVQEADYFGLTSPDVTPMVWPYSQGFGHAAGSTVAGPAVVVEFDHHSAY